MDCCGQAWGPRDLFIAYSLVRSFHSHDPRHAPVRHPRRCPVCGPPVQRFHRQEEEAGGPGGRVRRQRLRLAPDEVTPAQAAVRCPALHHPQRRRARPLRGGRCGRGDEGMGAGEGSDPLYPLVPAPHRPHRREARLLPEPHQGRPRDHGVQRQGTGAGRAGRVVVPVRAACAPPSRPAATRHGIPPRPPSSWRAPAAPTCAFPRRSPRGRGTRWTRRPRCSAPSTRWISSPGVRSRSSARRPSPCGPPWDRSRSSSSSTRSSSIADPTW